MPVCPVDVIYAVPGYEVPPEKLSAAKAKAKDFAGKQRRLKQERDAVVERTLARLASLGGAHA